MSPRPFSAQFDWQMPAGGDDMETMPTGLNARSGMGRLAAVLAGMFLAAALLVSFTPADAQAYTKAENKAYKRCVTAIMDYQHQPQYIVVDVKDLKLTYKQICAVFDRVHYDGHYFWVYTFGVPPKTTDSITFRCLYGDSKITSMRKAWKNKVAAAMKWAPKQMPAAERIHMLHDWLITNSDYVYDDNVAHKFSYGTIVKGRGDCLSFTLGMRALLDEAGFTTDIAYDHRPNVDYHAWVRVKLGKTWYNIDPTWDNAYSGKYYWPDGICHMFLLVNDYFMEKDNIAGTHPGFHAAHKNLSKRYATKYQNRDWENSCRGWLKVGKTFKNGSYTFKVLKGHKVKLVKCTARSAKSLTIPATAAVRGHAYKVTSVAPGVFAKTSAKTLVVSSPSLNKSGLKRCLSKSKVVKVKVQASSVKRSVYKKYREYFEATNVGKRVKVSYLR